MLQVNFDLPQDRRRMQFLHPGPASQNGFHLTSHRQLETDEIQPHVRQEKETSEDSDSRCQFHQLFTSSFLRTKEFC